MTIDDIIQNGRIVTQSQIDGDFEGFDDEMLFPLNNGQFWIQKNYRYWYRYSYMPRVVIYQFRGAFFLTIHELKEFVEVERLDSVKEYTIVSDFTGWTGETIFEMENGEVWQQAAYSYHYSYSFRPKALIYSYGFGTKMQVNGESIQVRRVR